MRKAIIVGIFLVKGISEMAREDLAGKMIAITSIAILLLAGWAILGCVLSILG